MNQKIAEGTRSVLYGAHSIIHSWYVIKAWRILYSEWPSFQEMASILLHDIGYWGMDYYTKGSNAGHAELGARVAGSLLGPDYALLVLGHSSAACKEFGIKPSKLERPDEYSWLICPMWWLRWNKRVEAYINSPEDWVAIVKTNWDRTDRLTGTQMANKLREAKLKEDL